MAVELVGDGTGAQVEDDALVLLIMCCHPALTPSSAIALTLRAVGGLTTAEIANAFLVPEATMAQRISRAKAGIKASGIPFSLPEEPERAGRPGGRPPRAVSHVQRGVGEQQRPDAPAGGSVRGGDPARSNAARSAAARSRGSRAARPHAADRRAPRASRTGPQGEPIPLDEQDRTRWDRRLVAEGTALSQMADNPMVALTRAIAAAMVHGPGALRHHLAAAERTAGLPERNYLLAKAARVRATLVPGGQM